MSQATVSKATFLGVGPCLPRNCAPNPCTTEIGLGAEAIEASSTVSIRTSFGGPLVEGLGSPFGSLVEGLDPSKLLRVVTILAIGFTWFAIGLVGLVEL